MADVDFAGPWFAHLRPIEVEGRGRHGNGSTVVEVALRLDELIERRLVVAAHAQGHRVVHAFWDYPVGASSPTVHVKVTGLPRAHPDGASAIKISYTPIAAAYPSAREQRAFDR